MRRYAPARAARIDRGPSAGVPVASKLPIHLRAIACRDRGAMSACSHFALEREQHLLGASGALWSDREQGVRNVQDGESIRVGHWG